MSRSSCLLTNLVLIWVIFACNLVFPAAFQVKALVPRTRNRSLPKSQPTRNDKLWQREGRLAKRKFYKSSTSTTLTSANPTYSTAPDRRSLILEAVFTLQGPLSLFLLLLMAVTLTLPITSWLTSLGGSLVQAYAHSMTQYALPTKMATGAALATLGDALAQSREKRPYDARRAASFAAFDSCWRMSQHTTLPLVIGKCQGRVLHWLWRILSPSSSIHRVHALAVVERTLTYQLVVTPLLYYPVFFCFTGILQGLSVRETIERAVRNFLPCWKRNLVFWIPVQGLMFAWVKPQWQIPYVCAMGILWSCILSATTGRAKT